MSQPLTRKEAAAKLKIAISTLDNWIRTGVIRAAKIRHTVRIPQSEIERVMNTGGVI
jgi:excisionase family DNA binding protein